MKNRNTYQEVEKMSSSSTALCYLNNKIAAFIVYELQNLPLTANLITSFSFFLVLLGILFLFLDFKLLFIIFLILSYTFDNVDGIWARLKKQTSEFGKFLDLFLDKVKDFLIDLTFIIYYYYAVQEYVTNPRILIISVSLYLICKALFYMARDFNPRPNTKKDKIKILAYGGAEKFIIVYTLLTFSFGFFLVYIIGYFFLYFINIFIRLHKTSLDLVKSKR